jgi:hypothetical protein
MLAAASLLLVFSQVYAEKPAYLGAQKCKECHSGTQKNNLYQKWLKEPHAKAFESLKAKGQEKNPKCLLCHTTGFNEGGYKIGAPGTSKFEGVQCESCHGAGSMYIEHMEDIGKAIENGLILPMDSLCIKCHNRDCPSFKGFDYNKYNQKLIHAKGNTK